MSRQVTGILGSAVLLLIAGVSAAHATSVLLNSEAPYWEVGNRDKKLSQACSVGHFNQRDVGRYTVQLHNKAGGAAVLGVAKGNGFNLLDPTHLAQAGEQYFFRNDTTSNCQVFVSGRVGAPTAAGAAPAVAGATPQTTP